MYPEEGKEHLFQQLQSIGWSQVALEQVFAEISVQGKTVPEEGYYLQEAQLFGSPFFQDLWLAEDAQNSRLGAQELLVLAMNLVNMPEELSGDKAETDLLLARIAPNLTPHDGFWKIFSRTLRQAFPADDFSQRDGNQKLKKTATSVSLCHFLPAGPVGQRSLPSDWYDRCRSLGLLSKGLVCAAL